jgi:hypothetical protein
VSENTTNELSEAAGAATERLLSAARRDETWSRKTEAEVLSPGGMSAFGKFDWRTYVPEEVRALWPDLSAETRLVAWLCARQASYWDEPPDD